MFEADRMFEPEEVSAVILLETLASNGETTDLRKYAFRQSPIYGSRYTFSPMVSLHLELAVGMPSAQPTKTPSNLPSKIPSHFPSQGPTTSPTDPPTSPPTASPTTNPRNNLKDVKISCVQFLSVSRLNGFMSRNGSHGLLPTCIDNLPPFLWNMHRR